MLLIIAVTIVSISIFIHIFYKFLVIINKENKKKYDYTSVQLPKVSLLKPVKDIDDEMELNFESFYNLDYPDYEIIFGVNSFDDPCNEIINRLKDKYPNITTKIYETGNVYINNPKITKLSIIEDYAEGEIYWLTDPNVRIEKETLKKLVYEYLTKNSKIVFSPIRGTGSKTFASIIENSYLNTFVSENIICSYKLFKQQMIVGKSMLIEKAALKTFGGFAFFKNYIAEDYMMGYEFEKMHFKVSTNYVWVSNINQNRSMKDFFNRIVRWAKLRYNMTLTSRIFYFLEILLNPIMISLVFAPFLGLQGLYLFLAASSAKLFLEYLNLLFVNFNDRKKLKVILLYPFAVILKDFLIFLAYFIPILSNKINWRGDKYKIGKKTMITVE